MPTSAEIRQQFLDFFRSKEHAIVDSSPVVPHDDPTLMFANAGMNQFKDVFLGTGSRPYTRAADTQKCIRAGGKHNDLDDVGQDTYHHTFFEMLGNWSFGDYFKKEAIAWAWELLTEVWGIDGTRLHATYFEGDAAEGLEPDNEARDFWREILPPERVHPGNKKDNFWEMGDTGPCGPCSELHIDLTPDKSGASLVNAGDARVIEIWNLVFIQFNRGPDSKLSPLPARHVDTGMGFERVTAVLQGKNSNYDTDVFTPIFDAIQKRCGVGPYRGTLPGDEKSKGASQEQVMLDVSYRVVADHLRCLTFALSDGAVPSNEGRGYVLRRILRRGVRYGRQYLGQTEPFLCDLVPAVVEHMGEFFPELRSAHGGKNLQHVTELIRDEEESFGRTLDRGIKLFDEAADHAVKRHHGKISGDDAFKLHDTYGFPIDLTELMAEERGLHIDIGEYERLMDEARRKAQAAAGGGSGEAMHALTEFVQKDDTPATAFGGYATRSMVAEGTFVKVLVGRKDRYEPAVASAGDHVAIAVAATPFYAEAGGQVGDHGTITVGDAVVNVENTIKVGGVYFHLGFVQSGTLSSTDGVEVSLNVDDPHRIPTMQNHTTTHMLNWALREVLGDHVAQKGSLVDAEKTRFDFAHNKPMTDEELGRVENLVNEMITADHEVFIEEVPQEQARQINTLRAVFGEKYDDLVRVVSVGAPVGEMLASPGDEKWMQYAVEFCGGTHLSRSSEAEKFVLVSEEGVAKGVRRVVGITGDAAKAAEAAGEKLLKNAKELKTAAGEKLAEGVAGLTKELAETAVPIRVRHTIRERIAEIQKRLKAQEKEAAADAGAAVQQAVERLLAEAATVGEVAVVVGEVPSGPADALRGAIDWVRNKTEASAILLASGGDDGKVTLIAGMSKAVVGKGVKAGDLIKEVAPLVGGRGGGRPDMAQGGGTDPAGIQAAIDRARAWIAEKLG